MNTSADRLPVTYIRPGAWGLRLAFAEIWQARELLYFLVWRDVKVRYKQTVLGVGWAVVQPVMAMVVFTALFNKLGRMPSDNQPYPLFSFTGLVPWSYFAAAVAAGASSLSASRYLIARVYFPRVLVPLAAVVTPAVDMLIAFGVLLLMIAGYRMADHAVAPSAFALLLLPVLMLFLLLTTLSITLWTSALSVNYRDMRYLIPFGTQMLLFLTPIAYPTSMLPDRWWRVLYGLNPMATIVEGFRSVLLGGPPPGPMSLVSLAIVLVAFVSGLAYFRSVESRIVDLI